VARPSLAPQGYGKGAQTPKGQRRQDLILKTAAELFAEHGFGQVSINDIGYAAGVTGPAIYRYFSSKEELLVSVYRRLHEVSGEGLARAIEENSDPVEALVALIDVQIQLATEHGAKMRVVEAEWQHVPADALASLRAENRRQLRIMQDALSRARPDLDASEVEVTTHAVIALISSIIRRRRTKPLTPTQLERLRIVAHCAAFCGSFCDAATTVPAR
jgi:AcrR family transcriptional regulator